MRAGFFFFEAVVSRAAFAAPPRRPLFGRFAAIVTEVYPDGFATATRAPRPVTLVILVADGLRPDTLDRHLATGQLPALAALRAQGSSHTLTTVFPSVTGSAYTPFLMGVHPGRAGLPGLRWFDRSRRATLWPANARSYVGLGGIRAEADLDPAVPTLFELEPRSLGGFTYVGRGLRGQRRIGNGVGFAARMAWTHFRADLEGWLRFDRWLGEELVYRIARQRPRFAFLAHPGVDKFSHQFGQDAPQVLDALRNVDATVAQLQDAFARAGRADELEIFIVSDHGHENISAHEDLAEVVATLGFSVRAHPWVVRGQDVAVMVSGNAMAHLYLDLRHRERPYWAPLAQRFTALRDALLERPSVDLILAPLSATRCEVHARSRGHAAVVLEGERYGYQRISGDPLQLGEDIAGLDAEESWDRSINGEYPDALVQIIANAQAARAGDLILSAAAGWDFRSRWEPILHRSGHGALRRRQMLVPLLTSRPSRGTLRRTVEVFDAALERLARASGRHEVVR